MLQLNSFPLADKVRSLKDLNDGRVLWQVLRKDPEHTMTLPWQFADGTRLGEIDANYFAEDLPAQGPTLSDHWLPRWQNSTYET